MSEACLRRVCGGSAGPSCHHLCPQHQSAVHMANLLSTGPTCCPQDLSADHFLVFLIHAVVLGDVSQTPIENGRSVSVHGASTATGRSAPRLRPYAEGRSGFRPVSRRRRRSPRPGCKQLCELDGPLGAELRPGFGGHPICVPLQLPSSREAAARERAGLVDPPA